MSISRQEEIIALLWMICAILAFGFNFNAWGWIFAIKSTLDHFCIIYFAIREIKIERGRQKTIERDKEWMRDED